VSGGETVSAELPGTARFVGREDEMTALLGGLEGARSGRGSLFLVRGEPGIGKSRLADEFVRRARSLDVRVLRGRCWEGAGAPAYWPWIQALRGYLRSAGPADAQRHLGRGAADLAQLLPEIRAIVPDLPAPPPDSDSARFQLFDSSASFLRNVAGTQVTALVLDDLHAADIPSVLLLRFLASEMGDMRLLVVATYRDLELSPGHPVRAVLQETERESLTRTISLSGLPQNAVGAFLTSAIGLTPTARLVHGMWRETGGNPLFLGEAVRLMASEGSLESVAASGTVRVSVPAGVREVIARRLRQLSPPTVEALKIGAALGPEFSIETLRRVGAYTDSVLGELLGSASAEGLLTAAVGSVGRLRFSHGLIREVLYQETPPVERGRLHRRIAGIMEDLYAGALDSNSAELAHHWFEAAAEPSEDQGVPGARSIERAQIYARQAGELAARTLAYEEASRHFRLALQLHDLDRSDNGLERTELLLLIGDADARAGDLEGARRTFLEAGKQASRSGSARQLAAAALGYGGRFVWVRAGRDTHLVPLLQDALGRLGGEHDRLRVRLLSRLACAWRDSPEHRAESDVLSQEAVDLARSLHDPASLGYALTGRYWATWWPDNIEQRLGVAQEMHAVASRASDAERLVDAHLALYASYAELTRMSEARAELDTVGRLAEELRQPAQMWLGPVNQTLLALMEGDFSRAEALLQEEAKPALPATPIRDDVSSARMHRFLLYREVERLAEIESAVRGSVDEFPWYPFHRAALALLLIDLGRREQALAVFLDLARDEFHAFYRDSLWLMGVALASEACARLGDASSALTLYGQLEPFAGIHAFGQGDGSLGAVDRYLGLLAANMGRLDEAARHLDDAIELNQRMGARPWAAHSQLDLALVLRQRNRSGDRRRAQELEHAALATAHELGMAALERKIGELSREAGADPRPSNEAPASAAVFRREGEYWTIAFGDDSFRLRDAKGLRYLARLLERPGRETLALELVQGGGSAPAQATNEADLRPTDLGDAGTRLDEQAKQEYRARLHELQQELDEAAAWNDPERAERARTEMDFLAREISGAVGLGGRDRLQGSASERARLSVSRAIRLAMARIAEHSPALGEHLETTIHTGTYCAYRPDPRVPIEWRQ
jgi:tetratricopeptide (TPR) repeat protein